MTTMFVQLRRVVYLLVLLQCCVCVTIANGEEGKEKEIAPVNQLEKVLKSVESKIDVLLSDAKGNISKVDGQVKLCQEVSKSAKSASVEANDMRGKIHDVMKKYPEASANEGDVERSTTETLLNNATNALEKTKQAVSNASTAVSTAMRLGSFLTNAHDKFKSLIRDHIPALNRYLTAINNSEKLVDMTKQKELANKSKEKQKASQEVMIKALTEGDRVLRSMRETIKQAETAEKAIVQLEDHISQLKKIIKERGFPARTKEPHRELQDDKKNHLPEKPKEIPQEKNGRGEAGKTVGVTGVIDSSETKELHEHSGGETVMDMSGSNNEVTDNSKLNPNEIDGITQTSQEHVSNEDVQKTQDQNNTQLVIAHTPDKEEKEENTNTDSKTETAMKNDTNPDTVQIHQTTKREDNESINKENVTENHESVQQRVTTNESHSLNLNQLKDSSNSPALLHSPLLLLLLWVLGCTLVC